MGVGKTGDGNFVGAVAVLCVCCDTSVRFQETVSGRRLSYFSRSRDVVSVLSIRPSLRALLILAMDMKEASAPLGERVLLQVLVATVDGAYEVDKAFDRPQVFIYCLGDAMGRVLDGNRRSYLYDSSSKRRSCQSVLVSQRHHLDTECSMDDSFGKKAINGFVLEKGYLVLVAEDPEFGGIREAHANEVELACIEPELEVFEGFLLYFG